LYQHLSKEEYDKYIGDHLAEEAKQLKDLKEKMKDKYERIQNFYLKWNSTDCNKYKSIYKAYKNKQDRLRRKAVKLLSEARLKYSRTFETIIIFFILPYKIVYI
jgi:uncharacterized membrane protein